MRMILPCLDADLNKFTLVVAVDYIIEDEKIPRITKIIIISPPFLNGMNIEFEKLSLYQQLLITNKCVVFNLSSMLDHGIDQINKCVESGSIQN